MIKKQEKAKKNIFIKISVFVFTCYLLISLVSLQVDVYNGHNKLNNIKAQTEQIKMKNQELENILNNNNDEYIKKIAREKLGYVSPGERVFVDVSGN